MVAMYGLGLMCPVHEGLAPSDVDHGRVAVQARTPAGGLILFQAEVCRPSIDRAARWAARRAAEVGGQPSEAEAMSERCQ